MIMLFNAMSKILEFEQIKGFLLQYGRTVLYPLAVLLIALIISLIVSRLAKKWLTALLNRSRVRDDHLLKSFFSRTLTLSIYLIISLIALDRIGLDVQTFVAGLGITGLILGFGLKDVLSNFAAGLLLLIYRPFRAGELIEVEGSQGIIEELTIVNMQMTTNDGVRVIMPNSKVWGAKITNYSLSERRRIELNIKVREDFVEDAITKILAEFASDGRVLSTPAPSVRVSSLSDDAANLIIWAWVLPKDYQAANADLYLKLLNGLRQEQIQIL
jgi:small conductance mechanosensitive channel